MINHARTLLLNINGDVSPNNDYPGEEYVPADYRAITVPSNLTRIRNMLFGTIPDRAMLNYRLRQLLTLVHSNELRAYITDLDPRVTYWPLKKDDLLTGSTFGASFLRLAGSATWSITVLGNPSTATSNTKLYDQWQVEILNATNVRITHQLPANEVVTTTYTANSGVSNPISLPGSMFQFVMGVGVLGAGNWPTWQVRHLARPVLELSDIYLALQIAMDQDIETLFSFDNEPYLTCSQLWSMPNGPIAYKLGAIVVALAYRLDEVYKKQV